MKILNIIRILTLALGPMLASSFLSGCAVSDSEEGAVTARVAVVVDETGSFAADLPTAAKIVARFIRENALAGDSEVYLITIDRQPRVLQHYRADELLDDTGNKVLEKIKMPNPADGTDIVNALRLAEMKLHKTTDSKPGKLFLMAFSDMYVDPATTPAGKKSFPQLEEFEWAKLNGVTANFYFVASDKEPAVTELLKKSGISGKVLDASESRRIHPENELEGKDTE